MHLQNKIARGIGLSAYQCVLFVIHPIGSMTSAVLSSLPLCVAPIVFTEGNETHKMACLHARRYETREQVQMIVPRHRFNSW